MKRLAYIIESVMVLASMAVQAQHQYYFRVGDTIWGRDTIYHYQWWSEQWLSDPSQHLYIGLDFRPNDANYVEGYYNNMVFGNNLGNGVILRYCYTDQPLKIVGIASACYSKETEGNWRHLDEPTLYPEYLELYDADTGRNSFTRVAQVEWDYSVQPRIMAVQCRTRPGPFSFPCCGYPPSDYVEYVPIREYYFEKPVTVYDSFYVGHTSNSNYEPGFGCGDHIVFAYGNRFGLYVLGYDPYDDFARTLDSCTDHSCNATGPHLYKYRYFVYNNAGIVDSTYQAPCDTNWEASRWRWRTSCFFMLDFPIVEIDSSVYHRPQYQCPAVEDLHIGHQDAGSVVLLWSSLAEQLRWEVSYGPQGTPPDSGTVLMAAIPAIMIPGLDSSTHYSAYIRAVCMHDSLVYSDWSEPLDICICDTGGTTAIETPLLEQLTYLMPNPANHEVQVLSSYGMTRVEAYTPQGKRMTDMKVKGLGTTLDVSNWPAGMYIVVIHTPAGNATKKLIVTR